MNKIVEENYTVLRTLLQVKRTKRNDPNRKKNHLGFGFLGHDFFKVVVGPLFRSPKLTRTDADIKVAVRAWVNPATRAAAGITYGHISDWETGNVTDMSNLFNGNIYGGGDSHVMLFDDDISAWDTSNVTTMKCTFYHALYFNGDLSGWNTSKVTSMLGMFWDARDFNGDIHTWDVSKVTIMRGMFKGARAFNGDISRWDVSNVTNFSQMFNSAIAFNRDISAWNISKRAVLFQVFHSPRTDSCPIWNVNKPKVIIEIERGSSCSCLTWFMCWMK